VNVLSLLGLVLAIGIVVDDAIVVVEAVMHHIEKGKSPKEATIKAMEEVSGPIVAISLVMMAVFVPVAFISGISGLLYQQFAITIAISVMFSAINALTLSPALSAMLLKAPDGKRTLLTPFYDGFNRIFDRFTGGYTSLVSILVRKLQMMKEVPGAQAVAFGPPPIPGLGTGAGFTMMLQDRAGNTPEYLEQQAARFIQAAQQRPERPVAVFRAQPHDRRDGAARHAGIHAADCRPAIHQPLQPFPRRRTLRRAGTRLQLGRCLARARGSGKRDTATRNGLRLVRHGVPEKTRRRHSHHRICLCDADGIPDPRRAVRELGTSAVGTARHTDAANANLAVLRAHNGLPLRLLLIGLPLCLLASWGFALVLNVESGLNDGICVPVLFILLALLVPQEMHQGTWSMALSLIAEEIGIGAAVAIALALLTGSMMRVASENRWSLPLWQPLIMPGLAVLGFSLAQWLGGSGFITAFVCGMVTGHLFGEHRHHFLQSNENYGDLLSICVWLLFGAVVVTKAWPYLSWQSWA
jgi:hypothetical protein